MRLLRSKRVTEDRVLELIRQESARHFDGVIDSITQHLVYRPVEVKLNGKVIAEAIVKDRPADG